MPYSEKVPAYNAPNYDVFSPTRRSDPRGVVLGTPLDGGQSYVPWIGLSTIRELALKHAAKTGLVPREEALSHAERETELEVALGNALDRIQELEARNERIAGLVRDGFKVQKIIGRPKQEARA